MCRLVHSFCVPPAISTARLKSFGWSSRTTVPLQAACLESDPALVCYLVRKDRHAHLAVLRCERSIGDHVKGAEERLQRRRLATGEPSLNSLRRDFEISGEALRATQSIGSCSQRLGVPAALIHPATQSRWSARRRANAWSCRTRACIFPV